MSLTLSDLPIIIGVLGAGGAFVVFCGKGIFFFAKLKTSVDTLTAVGVRLESKLETAQADAHEVAEDFRECFRDHASRIERLEDAAGLPERRQAVRRIAERHSRSPHHSDDMEIL